MNCVHENCNEYSKFLTALVHGTLALQIFYPHVFTMDNTGVKERILLSVVDVSLTYAGIGGLVSKITL